MTAFLWVVLVCQAGETSLAFWKRLGRVLNQKMILFLRYLDYMLQMRLLSINATCIKLFLKRSFSQQCDFLTRNWLLQKKYRFEHDIMAMTVRTSTRETVKWSLLCLERLAV